MEEAPNVLIAIIRGITVSFLTPFKSVINLHIQDYSIPLIILHDAYLHILITHPKI
jgi:hypothetical protein